jgi:hypothetical protein
MKTLFESKTISVSITASHRDVYEFVSNPTNLPKWASGLGTSIESGGDEWIAHSPQGPVKLRFEKRNDLGVLDHYVIPGSGVKLYMPMRVVANGEGSEIIFTLFRQPDMNDEKFQEDAEWVERDLAALKKFLEAREADNLS